MADTYIYAIYNAYILIYTDIKRNKGKYYAKF